MRYNDCTICRDGPNTSYYELYTPKDKIMLEEPSLEKDLLENETIKNKCRTSKIYSQNLYAAMANNRFFYDNKEWTCSWRYAGGLVSEINGGSDYMDFYCSGISNAEGFVSEGFVTEEIRTDLLRLGWIVKPYE